jgi:hypothetical protein
MAFITLRMVFVLAWTIGDASSLSCQPPYRVDFVCSTSSGSITIVEHHCQM